MAWAITKAYDYDAQRINWSWIFDDWDIANNTGPRNIFTSFIPPSLELSLRYPPPRPLVSLTRLQLLVRKSAGARTGGGVICPGRAGGADSRGDAAWSRR